MRWLALPLLVLALVVPALADPSPRADAGAAIAPPHPSAQVSLRDGAAAADALAALLSAEEAPDVCTDALHALAALGLRRASALPRIRALAAAPDGEERAAALEALGRLGDADDVDRLLDALSAEDGALRATALRALRTLSGRRLAPSPLRCRLWWASNATVLTGAVEQAIRDTERAVAAGQSTADVRRVLARDGWVALGLVRRAVHRWLEGGDHHLRAEAYQAIAALRLADEAPAVAEAIRFANVDDAREAHAAAVVLGLATPDGLREYARLAAEQPGEDD